MIIVPDDALEMGVKIWPPPNNTTVQGASIDLHIEGTDFITPTANYRLYGMDDSIFLGKEIPYRVNGAANDSLVIKSKKFVLTSTLEIVTLPNDIAAFVEGRSSIGRTGLFIQNAGFIDPGFSGKITLELFNASDFDIYVPTGTRICQLIFYQMNKPTKLYSGKYQNQDRVTGSKIHKDYEAK